jgi:L-type amino acid transporter 9
MIVVLTSFELVNISYYILLPWLQVSANDAVAVSAATSLLGRPAGVVITLLVVISCAGSMTSNVFTVGRLTINAAQRNYLPAFFSKRGLPYKRDDEDDVSTFDAPLYIFCPTTCYIATLTYISDTQTFLQPS